MPAAGTRYERATVHGALDSAYVAAANGEHAHLIREVARNSNRIHNTGMPILSLQWNVDGDPASSDQGILADYGTFPQWQKLWPTPLLVPHQPQLRLGWVDIWAQISNGATLYLQIGTSAIPFLSTASLSADNVVALAGNGSMTSYSSAGALPLGTSPMEYLDFGVLVPPGALADVADVGTNTGTVDYVWNNGFNDDTAAFAAALDSGFYAVAFFDADDALITTRRVVAAGNEGSTYSGPSTFLATSPRFSVQESRALHGTTYEIWDASSYRFASIVITEADASAL